MSEKDRPTSRRSVLESFLTPREKKPRLVVAENYPNDTLREAAALARELQTTPAPSVTPPNTPQSTPREPNDYPTYYTTEGIAEDRSHDPAPYPTKDPATSPTTPRVTPQQRPPSPYPSSSPSFYPTRYPSISSDFSEYPLTQKQKEVLTFLYNKPQKLTSKAEIASFTGLSFETIKKIMQVLIKNKFIFKEGDRYTKGKFQGFKYTVNEDLCSKSLYPPNAPTAYPAPYPTSYPTNVLPDQRSGLLPHHLDDDLLCSKNNPHLAVRLDSETLRDMYPQLCEVGFRAEHLEQVIKAWTVMKLHMGEIHDSLEKAEWDVQHNEQKMEKPLGYVLSALKRGSYTAPKGFKFRRQIQAEESAKVAAELRALAEKEVADRFEHWWLHELSDDQRKEIDRELTKSAPILPPQGRFREAARFEYFSQRCYSRSNGD